MKSEIEGKVVVITGASSGIGKATAILLASQGAKVVMGARRPERLAEIAALISEAGGEAVYKVTDVRHRGELNALVQTALDHFGKLDVMINNAGVSQLSLIDELDVEGWEEMIDVNLKGTLYGIAAAIPVFRRQSSGHIINIISTSGIKIVPMQAVYAGTKNAIRTISEAMRQESKGRWRVTGISPGLVQTDFAGAIKNEEMRAVINEKMDSLGIDPEAVARAVAYAIGMPAQVDVADIVIIPALQD
jgi:NADP-dependent 3-hydroxy acid dehydrogenase YdfG